ncbi:hypothetical protein CI610_03048 [invertebrate metagenome]|uniref:Fido domain-containing protein n=1 Tax=invertebrate metagenome TaxID=1711999 RepID=A0A2H9T493_9ZZZZ
MKPNRDVAIQLAIREIPSLVHNTALLENVNFTLPEIQTLLDGVTVGGHKLSDQTMVLHQNKAWRFLIEQLKSKKFVFNKDTALKLHSIAGAEEALEWGCFRSGSVTIAGSNHIPCEAKNLDAQWKYMEEQVAQIIDVYDRATTVYLEIAYNQFFWDTNKRTGRLLMNGIILDAGFPLINVPALKQAEFNNLMLDYYESHDYKPMNEFLRGCIHPKILENFS